MLRHLAFLQALAAMEDDSADWHSTSAGLVVLRLVDAWLDRGGREPGGDRWGVTAVRGAVAAMPAGDPARAILTGVVDLVEAPGAASAAAVAPRLMAYARKLDFAGQWQLAADVYERVIECLDVTVDIDLAADAHFRLAFCRRVLGELEVAERVYVEAGRLAGTIGDPVRMLRSEVGVAKVALARGAVPTAEHMLDSVITRADAVLVRQDAPLMRDFRGTVLHDRAVVAAQREQYELSIQLLNAAFQDIASSSARDRVLADMAQAFMKMGVRSAARDGFMVVALTAEEQFSRWSATINLLAIAAHDGMEPVFESYRRQLADVPLDPESRAYYEYTLGQGYCLFGHDDAARAALGRAMAIAERHGFNRILFQAEAQLTALEAGRRPQRTAATPVPAAIEGIATRMRTMREEATVGA